MIKPEQVPDEVAWKLHDKLWSVGGYSVDDIRAAIAAALNAWPGMSQLEENDSASIREMAALILPLPQEARDDQ
jgi:hypothetical protein